MELQVGSVIGDYQIIDTLGAGGMGKVFKVRNMISDRIEAMKVLLPDLESMPDLADRFLREIKVQASLEHPNIAQLHTAVRAGNQLLMVMEFVDGETLEHKLKQGPLPVPLALDCISQVLSALEFAHARGVVHRDIKPANMMLTPSGAVKLMDFGIAKATADQKLTMTGTTMGSLYYMSPEQIQGVATLDARADLYSVGVTLYELVTGKRPFDGDSQYAIMAAHLEKTPAPPITLDPRLPQVLNDLILVSVAKDPARRFQTAAAFRNALTSVAGAPQPAPARPATVAPPRVAPAAAAPPPPPMAPAAAAQSGSKRWLWMSIGGLAAAAAIVCAIEFAPWKPGKAASPAVGLAVMTSQAIPAPAADATPESTAAPIASPPQQAAPVTAAAAPPVQHSAAVKPAPTTIAAPAVSAPVQPPQPVPQQAAAPVPAPPQQQPAAVAAAPPAAPPVNRAELNQAREHLTKLHVRVSAIHSSLNSLQRSMSSQGLGLNAKYTQPQGLMDTYMQSATEAMNQSDLATAKEYCDKAERQIEILEKLLNL